MCHTSRPGSVLQALVTLMLLVQLALPTCHHWQAPCCVACTPFAKVPYFVSVVLCQVSCSIHCTAVVVTLLAGGVGFGLSCTATSRVLPAHCELGSRAGHAFVRGVWGPGWGAPTKALSRVYVYRFAHTYAKLSMYLCTAYHVLSQVVWITAAAATAAYKVHPVLQCRRAWIWLHVFQAAPVQALGGRQPAQRLTCSSCCSRVLGKQVLGTSLQL